MSPEPRQEQRTAAPTDSSEVRPLRPAEIRVGLTESFEREITEEDILAFARLSGDHNPLHVDAAYAAGTNFGRRIAHGAFEVGLASAMLGMFLPGQRVLLMSVQSRFPTPLFYPTRVNVRGTIVAWSEQTLRGTLKVAIEDLQTSTLAAEVSMGFTLHDVGVDDRVFPSAAPPVRARPLSDAPLVIVTGAAGGLGGALTRALAGDFEVLALTNRRPLDDLTRNQPGVTEVIVDLSAPGWEEELDRVRGGRSLYGIVHAAWPGAPQGGLLSVSDDALDMQLGFGAGHTVRLARYLSASAGGAGGRLVAIGSVYGTERPNIALAAYSLGKAVLEHVVRLLAPELARRQITVNAICPSVVAVGMNSHLNERQRLRESAQIPLGRLCEAGDVGGLVRYFLSPDAGFMSGQSVVLSGGQL